MKKYKVLALLLLTLLVVYSFVGCNESERVSYNVSKEADNFNVIRRLVVINGRTDKPVFELVGAFSFELKQTNGTRRIIAVVETGPNEYKKHSVGLPHEAFWSVEDISGASVNKYRYEVNFLPEMLLPVSVTQSE